MCIFLKDVSQFPRKNSFSSTSLKIETKPKDSDQILYDPRLTGIGLNERCSSYCITFMYDMYFRNTRHGHVDSASV
jgi:hypothetical protein